jgi:hypothetical protein
MALRLRDLGIPAVLISVGRASSPGIESIPEAAFPMIAELGLSRLVADLDGEVTETFENGWEHHPPQAKRGKWLHVQRTDLAEGIIREAVRRGTQVVQAHALPAIEVVGRQYRAAVDATGRAAAWSRPVRRYGTQIADLYDVPNVRGAPARIVKVADGWAYRLGVGDRATVGLMSPRARHRQTLDAVAPTLGVDAAAGQYLCRRPAFPQWSTRPIDGRRIAIGDAAFAFDPIAGSGIRFALASAFAAAPLVRTWAENGCAADVEAGARFYKTFVNQVRSSHWEFLTNAVHPPSPRALISFPATVVCVARRSRAELHIGSRIAVDDAIFVDSPSEVGETVLRWVGGVDLLRVEELARAAIPTRELINHLISAGIDRARAASVVAWCLKKNVLRAANSCSG